MKPHQSFPQTKKKRPAEWPGLLLGWLFIVGALFLIAYFVASVKPEGKLVCDTVGRSVSLTQFGSCRMERY